MWNSQDCLVLREKDNANGSEPTLARSSTSSRSSRMTCPLSRIASAGVCWEYVLTRQNIALYRSIKGRPMNEGALQVGYYVSHHVKGFVGSNRTHSVSHEDESARRHRSCQAPKRPDNICVLRNTIPWTFRTSLASLLVRNLVTRLELWPSHSTGPKPWKAFGPSWASKASSDVS